MTNLQKDLLIKVPAVTLGFWIIKILCTTLGVAVGGTGVFVGGTGVFVAAGQDDIRLAFVPNVKRLVTIVSRLIAELKTLKL
jgi:hypothetical protein